MINVSVVTVIGVTGTMGANVAGIFASFGDAKVYCVGRSIKRVRETIPRIVNSVKANAIEDKLVPADFSMLERCVAESDLVFESVAENIDIKSEVARLVGRCLRPFAVSCTGTSGLSIAKLASCYPRELRSRFFGAHMFNPPYSMSLCELVPTEYSDEELRQELSDYLIQRLYRTVVEVKDSPAFLGNRIGFQFINEALQYAERYSDNGGIDYIDAILGPFTGRAMAPLATSDYVGLDVHKAIVENVHANTCDYARDNFVFPPFAEGLVIQGRLGRKSGGGLYQTIRNDSGLKRMTVLDINTGQYRDTIPYVFPFAHSMRKSIAEGNYKEALTCLVRNRSQEALVCRHFLLGYIVYGLYAAGEVGRTAGAADDVMATGFNWCPPMALYQALSMVADVPGLIKASRPDLCAKVDLDALLDYAKPSAYDYRAYFRSGR